MASNTPAAMADALYNTRPYVSPASNAAWDREQVISRALRQYGTKPGLSYEAHLAVLDFYLRYARKATARQFPKPLDITLVRQGIEQLKAVPLERFPAWMRVATTARTDTQPCTCGRIKSAHLASFHG